VKWHMAHTAWFFETFMLERFEPRHSSFHPMFRMLFNSYYNGIGEKHERSRRGLLTRPSLEEVKAYRRNVDERVGELLSSMVSPEMEALIELGLQHEQQHQELMLTDVKHLLWANPLKPAYFPAEGASAEAQGELRWVAFHGGVTQIGHGSEGFCFDNEMPRHRQFIEPFSIALRSITNEEYLGFMEDGGYADPSLWLSEGWDWIGANRIAHPLYWQSDAQDPQRWREFTLHGMQPLDPHRTAMHLSYFEADAYARWAGARLPTEAEWELAARSDADIRGLFGDCWQWTSSSYAPYPGYRPAEGVIGEYNGKFMANQYVLRGSSLATPQGHARIAYRNFFPATARWQFTGVRLARSL